MGKHLLKLLCLVACMCIGTQLYAQTPLIQEGFEQGMPTTWTQEPATPTVGWSVSSNGLNGITAYGGSNYLSLYTTNSQGATKIISPMVDASGVNSLELSFYRIAEARSANLGYARDTLRVYLRTSATSAWVLTATYSTEATTWTKEVIDLSSLVTGNVQIAFEFNYGGGRGIALDDIRLASASVCFAPNALQSYRVNSTSATLMWNAYATASTYHVKVSTSRLANAATDVADAIDTTVYSKPLVITGLTPQTTYYYYINADCGDGDVSPWSAEGTFRTGCSVVSLPYTENFDATATINACWTVDYDPLGEWGTTSHSSYMPSLTSTTSYVHSPTRALTLKGYNYPSSDRQIKSWAITRELDITNVTNTQVAFWLYGSLTTQKLHVGLLTDVNDLSTFEEIGQVNVSRASTYEEVILPMTNINGNGKYLCFYVDGTEFNVTSSTTATFYIDDIEVAPIPACPKPTLLSCSRVTDTTAALHWVSSSTNYRVAYSTVENANPDTISHVVNVTGDSVVLNNLAGNTTYYWWVRSDCTAAGDGLGVWSEKSSFKTQCGGITTLPWNDDFDSYGTGSAIHPGCWISKATMSTGTTQYPSVSSTGTYGTGVGVMYFYASSGNRIMASTPRLDVPVNTLQMSFYCGIPSLGYRLIVGVCDDPSDFSTFTPVQTIAPMQTGAAGQKTYTVYFTAYTGAGKHIAILADGLQSATAGYVDDVVIDLAPSCIAPQTFTASNVAATTADLAWQSIAGESTWNVKINNRLTVDTTFATYRYNNVTTPALSLTGLAPDKAYYVYLQSVCNDEVTDWSYAGSFETGCSDIVSLPWTEEFEHRGTGASSFPTCWQKVTSNSTYPNVTTTAMNHTPGGVSKGALYFSASSTSTRNLILLPKVDVPGKTLQNMQLTLYGRYSSTTYSLVVGAMSNPADQSSFEPIDTLILSAANQWQEFVVSFANYTGNGQYIAITDQHRNGSVNYFYIDDLSLELIPTCPRPSVLEVSNIQETAATLTWEAGGSEQQWEVACYPAMGGSLATATRVMAQSTTATITGLTASTNYECYVRSICGANDTSNWCNTPCLFRTLNTPDNVPYSTSFNDAADNAKWTLTNENQANRWYIGTAVGNEATDKHGLYVSNDGGISNSYNISSTTYSYAYHTLRFTPGEYRIAFDWTGYGESTYDFLRAFLVPTNAELVGGVTNGITSATFVPKGWISLSATKLNQSATWQSVDTNVVVSDTTVYNLVFFWKNDGSGGVQPAAAVDNLNITAITCAAPTIRTEILDTHIGVDVNLFNGATTYEMAASTAKLTNMSSTTGVFYHQTSTNTHVDFDELTPNTTYYIYVRSFCGTTDTTEWREFVVTTECSLAQTPYTCDFESFTGTGTSTVPTCWHVPLDYTSGTTHYPYVYNNSSTAYSGTHYLYLYCPSAASDGVMMSTPRLDVNDMSEYRVEFYMRYSTTGNYCIIGVLDDPKDATTFVPVDTVFVTTANAWEKNVVSLANYNGNGKCVGFLSKPGVNGKTYNYVYIDDVTIVEDRMCQTPTNVAVTGVTATDARLNWDANNGLDFTILVTDKPVKPDTVIGDEDFVKVYMEDYTDAYIQMDGVFTVNTTYYAYVKADCQSADGKPSIWSSEVHFTTACNAVTVPYTEQFGTTRTGDDVLPPCWTGIAEVAGDVPNGYRETPHCYKNAGTAFCSDPIPNDSTSLRMYAYYSAATSTASAMSTKLYAALPLISGNMADYRMDLIYATTSGSIMLVGAMSDPNDASTFYAIDTIYGTSYWTPYTLALEKCVGHGDYVAFLVDGDFNQKTSIYYIDRLTVTQNTACSAPTNLRAINITGNTADITVNNVNAADSVVHIQVSTRSLGLNVEYIDSVPANEIMLDTIVNINNLPIHLDGLSGSSTYYIYARTVCGSNPATYSPRYYRNIPFKTDCGRVALPYSYNFDDKTSTGSTSKPTCWTSFSDNGGTTYPYINATYYSAPYGLYLYSTTSYVSYGVLPEIDVDSISKVRLDFMMRKSSSTYLLDVGVMTDPTDTATFTLIETISPTTTNVWEEAEIDFSSYTGNGKFIALRNGSTGSMYIDDVFVEYATNCKRPTLPSVTEISSNTVTVTWEAGESAETVWDIALCNKGVNVDPSKVTRTNADTFTYTNLRANANYDIYVRAVCDGASNSVSSWRGPLSFKTLCDAIVINDSLSFADDFDSYGTGSGISVMGCWIRGTNSTISYPYPSTTSHSGVASAYFYGGSSNYSYMATPEITGSALSDLKVKFWGRATSLNYKMKVGVMSNPLDYTTFTELEEIAVDATSTWQQFIVDLSSYQGTDKHIAFMTPIGASSYFYVDDVEIYVPGACEAPSVSCFAAKYDSVAVHLATRYPEVANWEVVVTTGANATTNVVVDTVITSLDLVLTSLQPSVSYNVFVRSACGTGYGDWSLPVHITTPCAAVIVNDTLNYTEDFEGQGSGTSAHPNCWTTGTNYSTAYPYIFSTTPLAGAASLYFYATSSTYSYAATPRIDGTPLKELNVSFLGAKTSATASYYIELGVMTDPNDYSTFTTLYRVDVPNSTATQSLSYNISNAPDGANYVAWRCPADITNYFKIDNIVITKNTGCSAPAIEIAGDTTVTNVTIYPVHAADNRFQVVFTQAATPTASGAVVDTVVNSTSLALNNLVPNTKYNVFARALCTNDTSAWSTLQSYRTPCAAVLIDLTHSFADGFEDYATGSANPLYCYTKHSTYNTSYPYVSATAYAGSNSLYFYAATTNTNNMVVLPEFKGLPLNQLRTSFMLRSSYAASELVVGAVTDVNDPTTFVAIDTVGVSTTGTWEPISVSLHTYQGNGRYIALKLDYPGSAVGFYLDDLLVEAIPSCAEPIVNFTGISSNSATVNITPAHAADSQWQVKLGTANDTLTATLVDTVLNTPSLALTGLNAATNYYLFARTICSASEVSEWTMENFITGMAIEQLPIVSNFEDSDAANNNSWLIYTKQGSPNNWYIGSAISKDGNKSMYVSADNGVTASYDNGQMLAFAARAFAQPQTDSLMLSFDWLCEGESSYDFLRVFLAPANVDFTTIAYTAITTTSTPEDWTSLTPTKLNLQATWQHYEDIINVPAGNHALVFVWRNDGSTIHAPGAAIDNVLLGARTTYTITDTVCDGYNYTANGFNIASTDISATSNTFTRTNLDSVINLTLFIAPTVLVEYTDTICAGETYTQYGFNASASGTYNQAFNSSLGCDSIVRLYLTVNPVYSTTDEVDITSADLPYTYGDTVFNAGTQSGTYTLHYQSVTGCDSIVTLTLNITAVGLDYAEGGLFALSPNPAHRGEKVRVDVNLSAAEREGMTVELYSNDGALISRITPTEQPIYITMPQVDGLYLVRVTTASGKVMYGKIVVK